MSFDAHKNFAASTVATVPSPAASGTTLTVATGTGANFPAAPFNAVVYPADATPSVSNAEIVRVTNKGTGDNWTVTRTQEGTGARTILAGDAIVAAVTAKTLTDVETELTAHEADSSGAHAASAISVADTGGNFTGSDVETVLAELAAAGGGSASLNVVGPKTADYTVAADDDVVLVSNASQTVHITLPAASGATGKRYSIVKTNTYTSAYACDVKVTGGAAISGATTRRLLGRGDSISVVSDGTNWNIVDGNVPQFSTYKEWYVWGGAPSGDGRSAATAFGTYAEAAAVFNSGDTVYLCGDGITEDVVVPAGIRIVGLGNRPLIAGVANAADSAVVSVEGDDVQLHNITIQLPASPVGAGLRLNGASRGSFRQVDIQAPAGTTPDSYPTVADAYPATTGGGTGVGGIGLLCNNGEGSNFEEVRITRCSIGIGIGQESSTNMMTRVVTTGCYQDLVQGLATSTGVSSTLLTAPYAYGGGNGGGWTINHMKSTTPAGDAAVPVVDLIGDGSSNYAGANNGENCFISPDWSESSYATTARIGSSGNMVIRPVSSPATTLLVEGQRNVFVDYRILGAGWTVNSDHNLFDGGWSNGTFAGAGSYNTFREVDLDSGVDMDLALTGTGNSFDRVTFNNGAGGSVPALAALGTRPFFPRAEAVVPVTYGANVAIDTRLGTHFVVDVTDGSDWTLKNPTDSGNSTTANVMATKQIAVEIRNSSGGAGGTITAESNWKLTGTITMPADGERLVLVAMFDGTDAVEMARSSAAAGGGGGGTPTLADVLGAGGDPGSGEITDALVVRLGGGVSTGPIMTLENDGTSTRPGTVWRYTRAGSDFDLITDDVASVQIGSSLVNMVANKLTAGDSIITPLYTLTGVPNSQIFKDDAGANWGVKGNYGVWRVMRLYGNASQSVAIFDVVDSAGNELMAITQEGRLQWVAANEQTTVGAAGAADALPATPTKYLKVTADDGTVLVIPAYAAS